MKCPNIDDIDFSRASIASINEIKRIQDLSSLLSKAVGLGSLANIFVGNNIVVASYSVYSHDFATMTEALKGVSALTRGRIETVAGRTLLKVTNYKERQFWNAIYMGCKKT